MLLPIGATIRCRDGAAGRLKYVVIDPDDGEVTHLIIERGMLLHRDIVVPAAWVEQSSEHEIVLNATVTDLNALPEYKEAAHDDAASAAPSTLSAKDAAKPLDRDTVLFGRVTAALTADPRTASIPIEVIADRDTLTLKGKVPSPEIKRAAEEIARHVPGVVTVINELEIRQRERVPEPVVTMPPVRNE